MVAAGVSFFTASAQITTHPQSQPDAKNTAPEVNKTTDTAQSLIRGTDYIRVRDSEDSNHVHLEVSTRSFAPRVGAGASVHLVGAVHIGDKSYYDELQRILETYDLVLFEGVKPASTDGLLANADDAAKVKLTQSRQRLLAIMCERYRKKHREYPASPAALIEKLPGNTARIAGNAANDAWGHPMMFVVTPGEKQPILDILSLGSDGKEGGEGASAEVKFSQQRPLTRKEKDTTGEGLQSQLADALGLKFQLAEIDYTKPAWRNSDMSIDQVQARLEATGASGDDLFRLLDGSSFAGKLATFMLGFIKSSPAMAMNVKIMMVEALANADAMLARGGPGMNADFMRVIVVDRNTQVLDDLRNVINSEPNIRSIGIFYGAGHFPDMEARLIKDFDYALTGTQWHTAISLDLTSQPGAKSQVKQMRTMMESMAKRAAEQAQDADQNSQ